ncbi:glycosyl hydrolase [Tirmania nivea]|nr:glycosyl hydrolase [Tirmania nivea]
MKFITIGLFSVLGLVVRGVSAACARNLLVDDFTYFRAKLNLLGVYASDDYTMSSISAIPGKLTFTPKASSYYHTNFGCINAIKDDYKAIQFTVKAPAGGSATLELQTLSGGCGAADYQSHFVEITGLSGSTQLITVTLSRFTGASLSAVKTLVWEGFTGKIVAAWELGRIELVCPNAATGMSTTSSKSPSTVAFVTSRATCSAPLLIDDWISQSRLTFLFYNALTEPSSDDGTMKSIVVSSSTNRVTFTPKSGAYFYSNLGCLSATNKYGGISLRIKAPAGTTLTIELQSSASCNPNKFQSYDRTSQQLGWTFDGTEKLYNIPLASFTGLDNDHIMSIIFTMSKPVTFGPMALYCGSTVAEYIPPPRPTDDEPTATVPITSATPTAFIIDHFASSTENALGYWHGADEGMKTTYSGGKLTIVSNDTDLAWYTQLTGTCRDMRSYANAYLHVQYSGSNKFTIALQQHNSACNPDIAPYPETWDVVSADRYAVSATDIYVPLAHFSINKTRTIGFAFKAFQTTDPTTFEKIEIVSTAPTNVKIPAKVPTAPLYFACTRPNSFAFAIDDGVPKLAQEVMQIVREEGIKVTFFTVGAPLLDPTTNLSNVYKEMYSQGHQIALHSFTHPKMESISIVDGDWELTQDINAVKTALGISSKYFRPPFGNEGAHTRERLAKQIPGASVINWSVDVEDWLWAESATPEKQLEAFKRDVGKGGNLVVMHYLYPSTVGYLREFIQLAKKTGKTLMRVDQCLEDPEAPPL